MEGKVDTSAKDWQGSLVVGVGDCIVRTAQLAMCASVNDAGIG